MLHTIDIQMYVSEAALAASVLCWPNPEARRTSDHFLALAGRFAR